MRLLSLFAVLSLQASGSQYTHPERPLSFQYDDSRWELGKTPASATANDVDRAMAEKTLVTVQRRDADDKYHSRFSVVVDDPTKIKEKGKSPIQAYLKHAVEFLKSQRFQILSAEPAKLAQVPGEAYEIVAHQRDFGLTFRQVIFLGNWRGKPEAYLLTAAARTDRFKDQQAELDGFFKSFVLKP